MIFLSIAFSRISVVEMIAEWNKLSIFGVFILEFCWDFDWWNVAGIFIFFGGFGGDWFGAEWEGNWW